VREITLMLADGSTRICSRSENAELFATTLGGMGLTGIIVSARFTLIPIETATMVQQTLRTTNLTETMAAFEVRAGATYSVAWLDCLARGEKLGRAVMVTGEHAPRAAMPLAANPLIIAPKKSCSIPFNLPAFTLNRFSIAAFNALYYARAKNGTRMVDYESFFYPLDGVRHWNRIYGKPGFVQYQCVLPKASSAEGLEVLLTRIADAKLGSFLAVLKLLGAGNRYLSFPMEGFTLALDFPATPGVFALLNELDSIVVAHGGRLYLAKDARMSAAMLQSGYPDLDAFLALRHEVDATGKFSSLQSKRLGL
jgi:FAD/FMN-containing dehydrogenase